MDGARRRQPATPSPPSGRIAAARLFFALWPDPLARTHLARWAAALHRTCGGRRVRDEQLHATLAFLGNVPLARLPELAKLAACLSVSGFTLQFDAPGCWPRQRLLWAAPVAVPDDLAALAARLASALQAAGLRTEDRPYFPHVTLVRDATCRRLPVLDGFAWDVGEFALVESRLGSGATYRLIGRWPLAARVRSARADRMNG
jgi:2'-5' RNA ligase